MTEQELTARRKTMADGIPDGGAVAGLEVLETLAAERYGDRLHPGWLPRTVEQSQAILERHGLTGPFSVADLT